MTLEKSINRLDKEGFEIILKQEFYPELRFYDFGAVAFFAKIIEWEFLNFSEENTYDKFLILNETLMNMGM